MLFQIALAVAIAFQNFDGIGGKETEQEIEIGLQRVLVLEGVAQLPQSAESILHDLFCHGHIVHHLTGKGDEGFIEMPIKHAERFVVVAMYDFEI